MIAFLTKKELGEGIRAIFPDQNISLYVLPGGLLNQNVWFEANGLRMVAKVYRKNMRHADLEEVHRVMTFVAEKGVPVASPLFLSSIRGFDVGIYPFVRGTHPKRYRNEREIIRVMGKTLGLIHASLNEFQSNFPKKTSEDLISWDREKFLAEIDDVRKEAHRKGLCANDAFDKHLNIYQRIVESDSWDDRLFRKLPIRLCHGDFHTKNILVEGSQINAILDWEKFGWNWRGFEIMRSIIFNCRKNKKELDWNLVDVYLAAYRPYAELLPLERELAFECGYRKALFSLWAERGWLNGQKKLFSNMQRRASILPELHAHQQEYSARIANLLK